MTKQSFSFPARIARRFPDPVFGSTHNINRYVLFVSARDVPKGLPFDPNARIPNINRRVYKDLERSLLNQLGEPGSFHLKHKGITLVADKVEQRDGRYVVTVAKGQGILDGGHTYELVTMDRDDELPEAQFIKFEILTDIPSEWIPEIAGGLNTSVQVQQMSLDNLAGEFDWVKSELKGEPYFGEIAWRENEAGEFDARDIIAILTCFNIDLFPNDEDQHPVAAYEKKSIALKLFEDNPDTYKRLRPLLKEILSLHDIIRFESQELWNAAGGKYGNLAFVEKRERGRYAFPFISKSSEFRLTTGALYPILASFRWMIEESPKKNLKWRGGYKQVYARWRASGDELLRIVGQSSTELGRNPNAIGRSRSLWTSLHGKVAMRDLLETAKQSA
jgi:hypothetical protein